MVERENTYQTLAARQTLTLQILQRLLSTACHDYNNSLSILLNSASLLTPLIPATPAAQNTLPMMTRSAERALALTNQLHTLGRKCRLNPSLQQVNEHLERLRPIFPHYLGNVEVRLNLAEQLPAVEEDAGRLEELLLLLASAGCDGPERVTQLTLTTESETLPEAVDEDWAGFQPGLYVKLIAHVQYTPELAGPSNPVSPAPSVSAESEPLQPLRQAMLRLLVRRLQGHAVFLPGPKHALLVLVYLPAQQNSPPPAARPARPATILLVEDEPVVSQVIQTLLRREGYQTLAALNGAEALRLCQQQESIDVLISDVHLADSNGVELAQQLRALHPSMGIIFMSGYASDILNRENELVRQSAFLQKPIHPRELMATVSTLLQRKQ